MAKLELPIYGFSDAELGGIVKSLNSIPQKVEQYYTLSVEPMRSPSRYKYYFAYLLPYFIRALDLKTIDNHTGHLRPIAPEELHEYLKGVYNVALLVDPVHNGHFIQVTKDTAGLSSKEFYLFEEKVIRGFFNGATADLLTDYELIEPFIDRQTWTEQMINRKIF